MNANAEPVRLPSHLLQEIRAGNCVAFVGAGFSASVLPGWKDLLWKLAERCAHEETRRAARSMLEGGGDSRELEAAAQMLRDAMGAGFRAVLRDLMSAAPPDARMQERLHWLRGIPFHSVLTTNFDPLLAGALPGPQAYQDFLRMPRSKWWNARFWGGRKEHGAPVLKLHGDVMAEQGDLVFSRREYRERLYRSPGYLTFLRSVFATRTVLYLGFSFTDAYLNELRSEILALLPEKPVWPIAYAVVADATQSVGDYYQRHEGIQLLSYSNADKRHEGFDAYLRAIHEQTNATHRMGQKLGGKNILWLDAHPRNNDPGKRLLGEAAKRAQEALGRLDDVLVWQDAIAALKEAEARGSPYDLVITHWGHECAETRAGARCSTAERFLKEVRREDLRVPVIVFTRNEDAEHRKRTVLAAGALAFTFHWETLFREVETLFSPAEETG